MNYAFLKLLLLGLSASQASALLRTDSQVVLGSSDSPDRNTPIHTVDDAILLALRRNPDPVDALVSLRPELAKELAEPRLLHLLGHNKPQWMTEGDKLRLRREGQKFKDITDYQDDTSEAALLQDLDRHHARCLDTADELL
ncbi:hypothetical protein O1611_g7209 [Lasiodiplodia mahajangana]|uniref:Uncharacterized protein n=1 Tax=Lasiodiplodia mahajangana TaxID=1108764 RepID=A0ACC2JG43_9PEZI|nr:hypothetical protein O1611_g7209 [Lasiodiplodia mahajangana]